MSNAGRDNYVGVQIGAIGPLALLRQILSVGEQLRPARRLGHELHAACPFKLEREPHRLLDAAAGGDDAVVAQNECLLIAEAARDRLAARLVDDEVGRLGEHRHARAEDRAVVSERQQRPVKR
jgi:hypothetical protein